MNSKSNERQNFARPNIQSQRKKSPFITIYGGRKQEKASNTNSYKKILAIEVSRTPTQTSFQKNIRQAIEMRYLKSKNKNYKYEVIKENAILRNQYDLESQYDDFERVSQASQQIEQMKSFAYLKTQKFVNIHEFHSMIKATKQQSNDLRDNLRKRKLRTNTCRSIQNQRFFSKGFQKQSRSVSPLNQNIKGEVFNGYRKKKENNLNQHICKAEQILNPPNQKKKSLTAREANKDQAVIRQQHFLTINSSKPNTKHYLKDTFQLKNVSKLLITNTKGSTQIKQLSTITPKDQTSQKISKRKNQGRRYLMQKNQQRIFTNKTIIPEQIQYDKHEKMKKKSIRNTKILSLKKIQTEEPAESRESVKNSKLIFDHNSQYRSQTSKNNKRQLLQNYSSNVLISQNQDTEILTPSMSQQKWKLQEISFKFKPIESKDKFIEDKRQKSIELGLSLQKAYEKLLSERKIQQKQSNYFHKKETVNPKIQGKIMPTGILSTDETYNQNRSISKNKRRKLRLQTQYESRQYEQKKYQPNQMKEHNINLSSRSKEGLFLESEKKSEEAKIFPRSNIKRTLKKRQKIERFSTIS